MNAGVTREGDIIQTIGNGTDAPNSYVKTHRIEETPDYSCYNLPHLIAFPHGSFN